MKIKNIERLEARISVNKKKLLKTAAELSGRTLTNFIVHASCEAAVRIINEYQQINLSTNDSEILIQALLSTPKQLDNE